MDTHRDFIRFRALMDQLCAALRPGDFKASDAMVQAYWDVLKDCPFEEVSANVKRYIATATRDTPFPRPASLRSRPAIVSAFAPDPNTERRERESIQRWEELRKNDPIAWEILLRTARAARRILELSEHDPGYDDALREQYRWDRLRYAPREEQEAAVNQYLGRT